MNRRSLRMLSSITAILLISAITVACSTKQQPSLAAEKSVDKDTTKLNPSFAPGGNFDLSKWELQLPTGSKFTTISSGKLQGPSGYQDLYFYTDKTDGSMTFMCPTTGTTSSGSLHPRTEFREITSGWATSGTNIMTVIEKVTQVPGNTAIGQIFQAPPSPSKPLLEVQYTKDGSLKLMLEDTNKGGSSTIHPIGNVPLGKPFTYSLSLTGTTITVTIDGKASTFTMPPSFEGEHFYFKVGNYDQTAKAGAPGATPGTIVQVYSLNVTHQPS
ncbi:polysaccharide lyase family 7 protein [Paenibacillus cremeus]|uniref:Polysaccharide lyase family 7 protein n=1 Tax=Paenibacillus cremeus TaxID=2163881 RepID=A0A559KGX2_9BACL|nr:polysaccharide lyase family 7 protein [Paenibacillus cremeus]TVY11372.1 polysaccharide lyase family 7 protein [Paenibacillus cremeus]